MHNRRISLHGEVGPAHALVPGKPKGYTAQDILEFHGWTVEPSGCWLWKGRTNDDGYGVVTHQYKFCLVHRLAYKTYVADPGDKHVLHHCDTPRCVRPDHLFLGTNGDNVKDKMEKGRQPKGEDHPRAKLTAEQVYQIRTELDVPQVEFAKRFHVNPSVISKIRSGKRWK